MTEDFLITRTRKELTTIARRHRVGGWHSMKKAELVQAILSARRRRADRAKQTRAYLAANAADSAAAANSLDRLDVEAIDSHWIHVRWKIGRSALRRAAAALKADWHRARPILRAFELGGDDVASATRLLAAEIEIHSGTDHWYVPVASPPGVYEFEVGYRTEGGRYHSVVRSQRVRTPPPGSRVTAADSKPGPGKFPAARLRANGPAAPQESSWQSAEVTAASRKPLSDGSFEGEFEFSIEAELLVHGVTHPCAETTLLGQPVQPGRDGTFSIRLSLPEGRQIIPAVVVTPDGSEQRTIVLSVERNTRELEPLLLDDEW